MNEWHTASYSETHGHCVEVCESESGAKVRDTKNRHLGALEFDSDQWVSLLATITR